MSEKKDPASFETSLTEAERACHAFLTEVLEMESGVDSFISTRGRGGIDCMVFDIGKMQTGDVAAFRATNYHWRATAEFYNRDRAELQKAVMRLLERFPVAPQFEANHPLLADTNVVCFRIAPETEAVSAISTQEIEPQKGAAKIPVYVCVVQFDVVFNAGRRSASLP